MTACCVRSNRTKKSNAKRNDRATLPTAHQRRSLPCSSRSDDGSKTEGTGRRRCAPSSVPEDQSEQAEEHVKAVTTCRHQAVTLKDCSVIRTAKLLFEPQSGLERKHSGKSLKIICLSTFDFKHQAWWPWRIGVHSMLHTLSGDGGEPSTTTSFAFPRRALEQSSVSPEGLLPSSASELSDSCFPFHVPKLLLRRP